ncbi:MAG: helix-turn-helix domain-containing protein [Lactococcus lactis]
MKKYEHLPFEIILSATEGDPEAIETVMKFYDSYISKLCLDAIIKVDTER